MAKKHKYDYFDAYEELSDLAVQEASVLVRAMENFTDAAALRACSMRPMRSSTPAT